MYTPTLCFTVTFYIMLEVWFGLGSETTWRKVIKSLLKHTMVLTPQTQMGIVLTSDLKYRFFFFFWLESGLELRPFTCQPSRLLSAYEKCKLNVSAVCNANIIFWWPGCFLSSVNELSSVCALSVAQSMWYIFSCAEDWGSDQPGKCAGLMLPGAVGHTAVFLFDKLHLIKYFSRTVRLILRLSQQSI